ncbi:MAG: apolipoprotein N-acyltransferase [Acidobacteriota bacterium]
MRNRSGSQERGKVSEFSQYTAGVSLRGWRIQWTPALAAAAGGLILALAFPRPDLAPLAWIALIPLIRGVIGTRFRTGFGRGAIFGLCFFGVLLYWTIPALHSHGELPWVASLVVFVLLTGYLSLFPATFGFLLAVLSRKSPEIALLGVPFLWTALEWIRAHLFTGFPWGLLGYTLHEFPALIQDASWSGVYGISFLIAGSNALLAASTARRGKWRWFFPVAALAIPLVIGLVGAWRIPEAAKVTLRIAAVQGNILQDEKWDPQIREKIIDDYLGLTREAIRAGVSMVVWPESSLPVAVAPALSGIRSGDPVRGRLEAAMRGSGTALLVGAVEYGSREGVPVVTNTAQFLPSSGDWAAPYEKVHLVPFVEYIPLKKGLFFLDRLVQGVIADFVPGDGPVLHRAGGIPFATLICYEMVFPHLVRDSNNAGARFLVNITNDGWFGRTSAPYQHFAMSAFRAVENRRWVVRVANTGISGFIDPYGRVQQKTDIMRKELLVGGVVPRDDRTPYSRFGDWFAGLCGMISVGLLIWVTLFRFKR